MRRRRGSPDYSDWRPLKAKTEKFRKGFDETFGSKESLENSSLQKSEELGKTTDLLECPYCCAPIGKVVWDSIYKVFICTVCDNKWSEDEVIEDFFEECPHCHAKHSVEWDDAAEEWRCVVCDQNPEKD